ncbi:serine hydrolase domain-containing protein [Acrocarpospora catenulata]|uniref:serine hydrolase domain-containing protein n=1 Tax=Acrocarpospora catenulata TaxID=2836182 RepID=UPI001BD9DD45|nr:serine hydrolase domain-containing protein [Acrocarpospora catenulata]
MRSAPTPVAHGLDPAGLAELDERLREHTDTGRLPGWHLLVTRHGETVHDRTYGLPGDALVRLYSMTKPVTSVAAMILCEEGRLDLTDPLERHLPAFRDMRIHTGGDANTPQTEPAKGSIQVRHLLQHTSGLSYGAFLDHPLDEIYRAHGLGSPRPPGRDLAQLTDAWAGLPLLFEPGTRWNYSVATDVLGRLIEVVSGQPLDVFLTERVLTPLGMADTTFTPTPAQRARLTRMYTHSETGDLVEHPDGTVLETSGFLCGGGGLLSTMADYHRFTQMLLNGGTLDGTRLLAPETVDLMTANHLPDGTDLARTAVTIPEPGRYDALGFGLGFAVDLDPLSRGVPCAPGQYTWSGAAGTTFLIDPYHQLTAIFLTQLLPSPQTAAIRTLLTHHLHTGLDNRAVG